MSDREAYNEIAKYHKKRQEKAQMECDNFKKENELFEYKSVPLEEMSDSKLTSTLEKMKISASICDEITQHIISVNEDLETLSKLKGNNQYYKIVAVKTSPDTILHTKVYLDNNNKIINTQYLK